MFLNLNQMTFIDTLPKTEEEIELFCILQEIQKQNSLPTSVYANGRIAVAEKLAELKVEYFKKLKQLQPETK